MENGKLIHKPIRMCVVCRQKFFKEELYRMQCRDNKLIKWQGIGRSFYICVNCIDNKRFVGYITKKCKLSKEEAKKQIFHFPFFTVNKKKEHT